MVSGAENLKCLGFNRRWQHLTNNGQNSLNTLYLCFRKESETKNDFRRRRGESSDRSPETCGELEIGHELEDDVGHFFEEVIEAPTAYKSVSTSGYVE